MVSAGFVKNRNLRERLLVYYETVVSRPFALSPGMTPLLAASLTGHTHIVEHLINAEYGLVTRQQRIDALELLGATYVDKRRDMVGALALWKRAMDYR